MTREDFQKMLRERRLFQYEVAAAIGVSEFTLSRWIRRPTAAQEEKIVAAIEELSKRR